MLALAASASACLAWVLSTRCLGSGRSASSFPHDAQAYTPHNLKPAQLSQKRQLHNIDVETQLFMPRSSVRRVGVHRQHPNNPLPGPLKAETFRKELTSILATGNKAKQATKLKLSPKPATPDRTVGRGTPLLLLPSPSTQGGAVRTGIERLSGVGFGGQCFGLAV